MDNTQFSHVESLKQLSTSIENFSSFLQGEAESDYKDLLSKMSAEPGVCSSPLRILDRADTKAALLEAFHSVSLALIRIKDTKRGVFSPADSFRQKDSVSDDFSKLFREHPVGKQMVQTLHLKKKLAFKKRTILKQEKMTANNNDGSGDMGSGPSAKVNIKGAARIVKASLPGKQL